MIFVCPYARAVFEGKREPDKSCLARASLLHKPLFAADSPVVSYSVIALLRDMDRTFFCRPVVSYSVIALLRDIGKASFLCTRSAW